MKGYENCMHACLHMAALVYQKKAPSRYVCLYGLKFHSNSPSSQQLRKFTATPLVHSNSASS